MAGKTMWMVRAGEGGKVVDDFRAKNVVAIGWTEIRDLKNVTDRKEILRMVEKAYPEKKEKHNLVAGSQISRFRNELRQDDRIITYDPASRVYIVGTILGGYEFAPSLIDQMPHAHKVNWEGQVERDRLSVATKNSLGAISTLFKVPSEAAEEIESSLEGKGKSESGNDTGELADNEELLRDYQSKSHEFIKDQITKLDWDDLQDIVAGLLRAMGYKTQVSPPGADRGRDIIASPDGFGFEQPRIVVEVKHRPGTRIGSQDIRSFLGGRHKDDKGLYVSTGGFSTDARYEAERASIPVMLMDLDDLVSALVEHYEKMDVEAKSLIRLTKIYWPI